MAGTAYTGGGAQTNYALGGIGHGMEPYQDYGYGYSTTPDGRVLGNAPPGYQIVYGPDGGTSLAPTPGYAGSEVNQFTSAASPLAGSVNNGSLQGLMSAAGFGGSNPSGMPPGAVGIPGSYVSNANGGINVSSPGVAGGPASNTTFSGNIAPIDMSAANAATFGKAKEQAGQTARSEIDSERGLLGAAGMLGSGAEAEETGKVVENAASQVNDITRQNAITESGQALDVAKANQSAALEQRGQDIAAQQAQAQLQLSAAEFASQQQLALLKTALGVGVSSPTGGSSYGTFALY